MMIARRFLIGFVGAALVVFVAIGQPVLAFSITPEIERCSDASGSTGGTRIASELTESTLGLADHHIFLSSSGLGLLS